MYNNSLQEQRRIKAKLQTSGISIAAVSMVLVYKMVLG